MISTLWTAAAMALLLAGTASAATPAAKCASDKNKEAGKYAVCRQRAEAAFAKTRDGTARGRALERCATKYRLRWRAIENNARGACPSAGDETALEQFLDGTTTDVAAALAGGPLAGRARTLKTGQAQCWNASGQVIPCAGTGQDGEWQTGLDRVYVDNGDGTITDTRTGLMWEKLTRDGTIHDKEHLYSWGEAFSVKLAGLNALGFAGYRDWRVPNVNELYSLVRLHQYSPAIASPAFHANCIVGCTVLTCSCTYTQSAMYWTSTSAHRDPGGAWFVGFHDGTVSRRSKGFDRAHVRAVRGG